MPSLIQSGLSWLHKQRAAHLTESASYTRASAGNSMPLSVAVTASQVKREVLDGNGIPVLITAQDFIITTAALGFEPAAGDIITYNGRRYEVAEYNGENCWRFTDITRLSLRIHTRDLGPAT